MKLPVSVLLASIALAACDGSSRDRAAIMEFCETEVGMETAECECLTDAAEEKLDYELFAKFADIARNNGEVDVAVSSNSTREQRQVFEFILEAAPRCVFGQMKAVERLSCN